MTLTRLFLAWVPVAVVFAAVGGLGAGLAKLSPTEAPDEWRKMALWRSLEAAAVTLFASLWFDSLGYIDVFWTTLNVQAAVFSTFAAVTFFVLYGSYVALKPPRLA